MAEQTQYTNAFDELNGRKIGLLRRIWQSRKWYGAEWYITGFGGLILVVILILAAFAPQISPYDPNEFIGAPFTPPGQGTQTLLTRAGEDLAVTPDNLDWAALTIGVQRNKNGKKVADANEASSQRFMTEDELLKGLDTAAVDYIFVDDELVPEVLAAYPGFEVVVSGLGTKFPLGTDNLGRDYVSRIIWGARTIMSVALVSALLSSVIGISLGLISGFASGALDRFLSLIMDSIYSFPGLLLAIAMVAMLGPGLVNVAVAVSVVYIPTFFRVVRGQVLTVKEELYVEAARSLGASAFSILTKYIFPNVIPSIVVVFSLNVADAILTEAGLSFIGLGLPPDIPDWGYDVSKGHSFLVAGHWWMITFPGIMITLVATGFSLLGEGLSEILNPRLVKN
jgi:peptide/nickel transport system permease protein